MESTSGYTYDLGGCVVEVVGTAINYPAQPDPQTALNWPTAQLYMGIPVLMANNAVWSVWRPPGRLPDGRVQVQLKGTLRSTMTLNVPVDCLDLPIWNVGYAVPVPDPEPDPEPVPSPEPPPPVVNDVPLPPEPEVVPDPPMTQP
jgi:hypothetical protein